MGSDEAASCQKPAPRNQKTEQWWIAAVHRLWEPVKSVREIELGMAGSKLDAIPKKGQCTEQQYDTLEEHCPKKEGLLHIYRWPVNHHWFE